MPHLTIEYSSNLPGYPEAQALADLNASLCASPEILDEADLKSRFVRTSGSFQIGTQPANRAFVHAQLRLLSGRSPEAKRTWRGASPRCCAATPRTLRACWYSSAWRSWTWTGRAT